MKSLAILAFGAVALAAPLFEKRDVVYDTVIEEVYETVYTTTTVWVDAPTEPTSSAAAFYEQPKVAVTSSSAAPTDASYAPYVASQIQPAQAAPAASSSSAPYVAPVVAANPATYVAPTPSTAAAPTTTEAPYVQQPAPTTTAAPTTTVAPYVAPAAASPATSTGSSSSGQGDHTGDITYYDVSVGLGSCGTSASNSDAVVALSYLDMNNGANPNANPLCGKKINIYYNGATHQATVFDTCPTCAEGSLDLTQSLFNAVAPGGDGRVHGVSWSFA